ncbi:putative acyl-CoA reductase [Ixodes scapularis]
MKYSEVQRFYQDEVIFITGATGFLGKALIEKLLRSCPGIERIYLLIRPKRDLSPPRRLELMLRSACFERLRQECPSSLKKLVVVDGDVREKKLGLESGDYERLASDVSMVFHTAADVRFNQSLRNAVKINMEGTKNVLDLCHDIKKMKAVVHVSTAFVHSDLDALEERVYPPTVKPDDIISLTKTLSEADLVKATPELVGAKANTYVLTKTLAESIVAEQGQGLPLVIVRPSGVSASWKEPFPGWVEGLSGGNGVIASALTGLVSTVLADKTAAMEIVPVDVVTNALIVAACQASRDERRTTQEQLRQHPRVYNCTSGSINKILFSKAERLTTQLARKHPPKTSFGRPGIKMTTNRIYKDVAVFVRNYIPALFFDLLGQRTGRKERMVEVVEKYKKFFEVATFLSIRSWKFSTDNFLQLHENCTQQDKEIFYIDIRPLNWESYWEDYVKGIRRHVLKQEPPMVADRQKQTERQ